MLKYFFCRQRFARHFGSKEVHRHHRLGRGLRGALGRGHRRISVQPPLRRHLDVIVLGQLLLLPPTRKEDRRRPEFAIPEGLGRASKSIPVLDRDEARDPSASCRIPEVDSRRCADEDDDDGPDDDAEVRLNRELFPTK